MEENEMRKKGYWVNATPNILFSYWCTITLIVSKIDSA